MTFSPAERDDIRREIEMFFSTFPTVAEGLYLKTWRAGPEAGQPRLPDLLTVMVLYCDNMGGWFSVVCRSAAGAASRPISRLFRRLRRAVRHLRVGGLTCRQI